MKVIHLHGQPVAGGRSPLICTPLVGSGKDAVARELAAILPLNPDVLEWRADHFQNLGNLPEVLEVAKVLKATAGPIPIIFTCRSVKEGGPAITLDEEAVVRLHVALCASRLVDFIDFELCNPPEHLERVREASRTHGVALILSYHNFQETPAAEVLASKFADAERFGADVAKVAVMPRTPADVLTLLGATWRASETISIPLIAMSMGGLGAVSRMAGGVFGSALTYAVGASSSAPGQVPITDLRIVLETLRASNPPAASGRSC